MLSNYSKKVQMGCIQRCLMKYKACDIGNICLVHAIECGVSIGLELFGKEISDE